MSNRLYEKIAYWSGAKQVRVWVILATEGAEVEVPVYPRVERGGKTRELVERTDTVGIVTKHRRSDEFFGEIVFNDTGITVPGEKSLECAARACRKKLDDLRAEEAREKADPVYALEKRLSSHDWYYAHSDDPRVIAAGERAWNELRKLCSDVTVLGKGSVARDLWAKHAPKAFKFPLGV